MPKRWRKSSIGEKNDCIASSLSKTLIFTYLSFSIIYMDDANQGVLEFIFEIQPLRALLKGCAW